MDTSGPYVVDCGDRAAFLRCRREWDFVARERRNREPVRPAAVLDPFRALRDALAIYYFPGMWDWQPAVVRPLVAKALADSVTRQRTEYLTAHAIDAIPGPQQDAVDSDAELAQRTLESYQAWAPSVDEFTPAQVLAEFDVLVPHPDRAGQALATNGRAVRFRDRVDVLAMDAANNLWVVEHRVVHGPWPDLDALRLDERALSWCWAWEQEYPGLTVAGTIYNELRLGHPETSPPPRGPRGTVPQHGPAQGRPWHEPDEPAGTGYDLRIQLGEEFRRVHVPRGRAEVAAFGRRLAHQLLDMIDPEVRPYPNPEPARCTRCAFRPPCLETETGTDADMILAESYRARSHQPRPGVLGDRTWSTGRGAAPPHGP